MDLNYREHYHCIDCNFHIFIKKEEMVRHYKWHRKREESLQHGFLRFSPLDNCTKRFGPCTHNGRQTHYHCLQVYSKTCLKRPLKKKTKWFIDLLLLNAGQKYFRMQHSAILLTCIKLSFVIKISVLLIFE